jgi:hypothetical protein
MPAGGRSWVEAGEAVRRSIDTPRASRGEQPGESYVAHHSIFWSDRIATIRCSRQCSSGDRYLLTASYFRLLLSPLFSYWVRCDAAYRLGLVSSYSSAGFLIVLDSLKVESRLTIFGNASVLIPVDVSY